MRTRRAQTQRAAAQVSIRQEPADRLLTTASERGTGFFQKTNAVWSRGKERVHRVYEERTASRGAGQGASAIGRRARCVLAVVDAGDGAAP